MSTNSAKSMSESRSGSLLRQYHLKNEMRNDLCLQLQRLSSEINAVSSFNSLLPAEIKSAIFYKAMQLPCPLNDGDSKGERSPTITPYFLGKICQDWRDLVWSTPLLWSNIHLSLTRRRCKAQADLLRDWLSKTASCPLSFCLTSREELDAWCCNPPVEILTMLRSVSERWKQAEVSIPPNELWLDIFAVEIPLPLLTTATVKFVPGYAEGHYMKLFSRAPQLSALHLYHPWLVGVLAPWHQLQEFTSENSSVDEICGFLHKAPNIIRCSFRDIKCWTHNFPGSSVMVDQPIQPLVLTCLEYIELWFGASVNMASARILESSKLPSLREVFLHGSFYWSDVAILPRITESFYASPLLEKFTLSGVLNSDYMLIEILENMPSIKELHLELDNSTMENPYLIRELVRRLCPSHTNILLPNLQNFTFHGRPSLNGHMSLFRDMLVYRYRQCTSQPTGLCAEQGAISQLQSVSLRTLGKHVINQDIQDELDILVQEGLVLSISTL